MLLHIHQHSHDAGAGEILLAVFLETLMITYFVLIMLLLIEYITVLSKGRWLKLMDQKRGFQIILAALLGIIPGCLGSFTAVSLYIHKVINFASINTTMIATSGDEAFIMFSMIPKEAFLINGILFVLAVLTGFILKGIIGNRTLIKLDENHLKVHHEHPECHCFVPSEIGSQLRNITFVRALLVTGLSIFLILLVTGVIGPDSWDWRRVTFFIATLIGLFVTVTVPDHFIEWHLWKHTIKKHIPKIFLWTLGALVAIELLMHYLHLEEWLHDNTLLILVAALLIGIIPQSGPNIIFITLFAGGHIPFSILLANSVVQDGHGSIPLLAESKSSFFTMKGINLLVGALVGAAGLLMGF